MMTDNGESAALTPLLREVLEAPYCDDLGCWAHESEDHKHTVRHGIVSMSFVAGALLAVSQMEEGHRG